MAKEYCVESKWTGWNGGYGSETDIAARMNQLAAQGWNLKRTEAARSWWWWFWPRIKLLMVFERDTTA